MVLAEPENFQLGQSSEILGDDSCEKSNTEVGHDVGYPDTLYPRLSPC